MFELIKVQAALNQFSLDGWLFYDFRGNNLLARRILDISEETMNTRRFFYYVPRSGQPVKLVHRIESETLDHLPGEKIVYLKWQELEAGIETMLRDSESIAMEYSPRNANPYISRVDAGTLELARESVEDIVPSGDLVQLFEAVWDAEQWDFHQKAGVETDKAFEIAWSFIATQIREQGSVEEAAVSDEIMNHFNETGLTTYHPPIVARAAHSGDPHYETGTGSDTAIREGDFVLIDLWAKLDVPRGVYSDMTRVGFAGQNVPESFAKIFQIVAEARDAAITLVEQAFQSGTSLQGWEVDQACRDVIDQAGYGSYFVHRTGHSIGQETHGNGANMDNLETHEERLVLPQTCFSIEPGIYLPEFGVRSEVNVFVDEQNQVHVTAGKRQTEILPILKEY
ncbi:MAG: M24 family metallopeptidase [Planctomycetes bacterium]|nr:M24 family metallopeptidase [Planctomycetota bacterium]MCH9725636.1 M24 family metallopeptidase [Planctomycetota bacterium]MCH9777690.1 M24 family metallopeptidase [Planctomycetota bacterium]MCH9792522.1 M24 family metallopeptidase [Planctomycetota bacterium]